MVLATVLSVSACAGGSSTAPSSGASAAPSPSAAASTACVLDAPASVPAGQEFEVSWTGAVTGDYIVVLPMGATAIVDEPYSNVTLGSPLKVMAPTTPGAYELACMKGDTTDVFKARQPITVE
jgi:hypothetical protein